MKKKTAQFNFKLLLQVISVVGIGVMLYLSKLHFDVDSESFCDLGSGLSCSSVNTSKYSKVLGIPMSFLGIGYFISILFATFQKPKKGKAKHDVDKYIFFGTIFVLMPSLYLTWTEIAILKNICVFCELSKVLMAMVLGIVGWKLWKSKVFPHYTHIAIVTVVGIVAAGMTWYLQTGSSNSNNYDNLAQCISEQNIVMYGSLTCAVCARTKDTFGKSFEYIDEIECHPRGDNPQVELCLQKEIQKTPTWIQEVDGEELQRISGFDGVDKLAAFAGCQDALEMDRMNQKEESR